MAYVDKNPFLIISTKYLSVISVDAGIARYKMSQVIIPFMTKTSLLSIPLGVGDVMVSWNANCCPSYLQTSATNIALEMWRFRATGPSFPPECTLNTARSVPSSVIFSRWKLVLNIFKTCWNTQKFQMAPYIYVYMFSKHDVCSFVSCNFQLIKWHSFGNKRQWKLPLKNLSFGRSSATPARTP